MEYWRKKKKKKKGKARECFLKNGSVFLKELIADCNGISNPIRMFSSDQISEATNYFDPKCFLDEDRGRYFNAIFTWYKGNTEGRPYAIKRHTEQLNLEEETGYNDIVLSARVSNHNGFLKLIGCCLEFPSPVLVFEDFDYTVLNDRGTVGSLDAPLLPWNVRLKIAIAITYLHTAFSRIIIHRDIKTTNVFLDKNGTAKLTDFSFAITLPEGESWLEDDLVTGTVGYLDPDYAMTGFVTEFTDVFSFGILMLVLLMGRPPYLDEPSEPLNIHVRDLQKSGEPVKFGGDSNDMKPDQMKRFLELALRCCEKKKEARPNMIMVAKQIKLIEKGSFGLF
ncbi:hypothetical protein Bca4012_021668 [Brassica carinata]